MANFINILFILRFINILRFNKTFIKNKDTNKIN